MLQCCFCSAVQAIAMPPPLSPVVSLFAMGCALLSRWTELGCPTGCLTIFRTVYRNALPPCPSISKFERLLPLHSSAASTSPALRWCWKRNPPGPGPISSAVRKVRKPSLARTRCRSVQFCSGLPRVPRNRDSRFVRDRVQCRLFS